MNYWLLSFIFVPKVHFGNILPAVGVFTNSNILYIKLLVITPTIGKIPLYYGPGGGSSGASSPLPDATIDSSKKSLTISGWLRNLSAIKSRL